MNAPILPSTPSPAATPPATPAMPTPTPAPTPQVMSLRDQFAIKALDMGPHDATVVAEVANEKGVKGSVAIVEHWHCVMAKKAYKLADAMMVESAKGATK
jgi:hypothetical protein